ncbi:MAG: glycosyltransferase family 39 protein [Anaerolineae bacterium]|nr:glycosyltransferase family 39 protein [Anaerolineae bacterium]MDW8100621.1 glycosyltransferase family 39 protein [Anaerolineae bacterium]
MSPAATWSRILLGLILVGYVVIASLYAVFTPAWQAPDEPAHYNYIRDLAEKGQLPILQPGDYNQGYLEEIKARRFPADMSVDPIRYESHQPPLYYVLAVPVYRLADGRLIALRLFSVALGVGLLWTIYRLLRIALPGREGLALGGTAFAAFLPQHIAMSAAVNNDILGEWILAGCAALSLAYLRSKGDWRRDRWLLLGLALLTGLGFLTKTTAYLAWPLVFLAILWRGASDGRDWARRLALGLGPGILLGLPWWVRNWLVYGPGDILGLRQHNLVVVGQPRTSEWLAQMGSVELLRQAGVTTFRSFWGQFGWMGVLMDSRIYLALAILSAVIAVGCLVAVWEVLQPGRRPGPHVRPRAIESLERGEQHHSDESSPATMINEGSAQRQVIAWMLVWLLLTIGAYVWYNLTFVQHQGRYLFPALPVWGLCFAVGLDRVLQPRLSQWMAGLLLIATLGYLVFGLSRGHVSRWTAALGGGAGIALGFVGLTPARWRGVYLALVYLGMAALDLLALFGFIVPQLRP